MPKLTGERGGYNYWAGRIRDHLIECHPKWGEVVDYVLTKHDPITKAQLQNSMTDGISQWQLSEALYAFIGKFISTDLYHNREKVCEQGNGLELWRRYAVDFRGYDKEIQEDGQLEFLTFDRCDNIKGLSSHLD